jgi:tRNA pseudouridine32 synthase/23S rRNA pseudouridine746 synthase
MTETDISVVYADDALLVLEKPPGLLCVPGKGEDKQDCLSARVQQHFADAKVVHRLDMATSGLMIMARGALAQRQLNEAFAQRLIHKRYVAVVDGLMTAPTEDWSMIDLPIKLDWPNRPRRVIHLTDGKPSSSRWRILELNRYSKTTCVELEPITGRSHQLRVHMQAINHPILGDALYGTTDSQNKANRLLLHASQIKLIHPVNMQALVFSSAPAF